VEPRDVAVELGLGVDALPGELVVRRGRAGDRLPAEEDLPALPGVVLQLGAAVALAVVDVLGAEHLDPRARPEEEDEHQGHEHRQAADRLVHRVLTTWVGASIDAGSNSGSGRRAWSLIRRRIATRVQFVRSEDPP